MNCTIKSLRTYSLLLTACLVGGLAQAQVPDDMLRRFGVLKGAIDQAQKSDAPTSATEAKVAAPSNATEYCDAIKASPVVKEYVAALAKVVEKNAVRVDADLRDYVGRRLDNDRGQLQQWVVGARAPTGETRKTSTTNFGRGVVSWASNCAAANHDNDLFLFFIENLNDSEKLRLQREKARKAIASTRSGTKLDFDLGYENQGFDVSRPSIWVTLAAFALPNGIANAELTGKSAASNLSGMIAPALLAHEKRTAQLQAEQKEKDRIESQRVASDKRAKEDTERIQNSPNGMLLQAYQAFQMVQACYDARKGYAIVYVSDPELNIAKEKMRQIDLKLKPRLQGASADQLWEKASAENGIRPNNVKGANVQQGQAFCRLYKEDMDAAAEKVLGRDVPKKTY